MWHINSMGGLTFNFLFLIIFFFRLTVTCRFCVISVKKNNDSQCISYGYTADIDLDAWKGSLKSHDDVIKWKHFPRYWPFVRGIHRSPVNSPQKGQWRGALMFSLICARINGWANNREAGDLRRHQAHCDVIVMNYSLTQPEQTSKQT